MALRDASLGPLLIAEAVVRRAEDWDPREADGVSFSAALERSLGDGKGMRFFQTRAAAVRVLAPLKAVKLFDHCAAVWLVTKSAKAPDGKLPDAVKLCATAYNHNHQCPLTVAQVRRATRDVFGYRVRARVAEACASCLTKEQEIESLKSELADVVQAERTRTSATGRAHENK